MTNAWGDLTTMLDACLVSGFNLKSVDSITRVGDVATVNISAGHQYQVNQVLLMAGATQAEYNGEVRVLTTTSSSFTFEVTGTPTTPATGTITAKVAPLGFEIAFTGTNKRAYRSKNPMSNRPYLRVDNAQDPLYNTAYAKKGKVTMAEGMSDIDTFVGARAPYDPAAPNKNEVATGSGVSVVDGWYKWYYAHNETTVGNGCSDSQTPGTLNRGWVLVGDDRGFYLFTEWNGTYGRAAYCFTDFESYRAGDSYNAILAATDAYVNASYNYASGQNASPDIFGYFNRTLDYTGKVLMKDHVQVGGTIRAGFTSLNTNNSQSISGYSTGIPWPNGPDYSLLLHPPYLRQENGHLRGKMPGMMWVLNDQPLQDQAVVDGVAGYAGRKFLIVNSGYGPSGNVSRLAFDITGPWW